MKPLSQKIVQGLSWRVRGYVGEPLSLLFQILCALPKWLLYGLSGLMPRNRRLWAFGTVCDDFGDNPKYLFLYAAQHVSQIEAVWVSGSPQMVARIRKMGMNAVRRNSIQGIWICLRAKYYLYSQEVSDIQLWTSRGAVRIYLTHGVPLKKIGRDITMGPSAQRYHDPSWKARFLKHPDFYIRPSFVLSTSGFVSESSLQTAFELPRERLIDLGFPRLDILQWEKNAIASHLELVGDRMGGEVLALFRRHRRVILYLPTFRDNCVESLDVALPDAGAIEALCAATDTLFVIKLHKWSTARAFGKTVAHLPHFVFVDWRVDTYPLMACADMLITDYSSVMFDFLLTHRPIVRYAYDLETYRTQNREFYHPYEALGIGTQVETFAVLMSTLRNLLGAPVGPNYEEDVIRRFHAYTDGRASQRVCNWLATIE